MHREVSEVLLKLSQLVMETGWKLKRLARRKATVKDLNELHETLTYCADAISQVADALLETDSREKHGT